MKKQKIWSQRKRQIKTRRHADTPNCDTYTTNIAIFINGKPAIYL
jgi:hypothetical protein